MHWIKYVGNTSLRENTEAPALECGCFHFIHETSKASLGAVEETSHQESIDGITSGQIVTVNFEQRLKVSRI